MQIKLLELDRGNLKHLTVCKQMRPGSFINCYQQTIDFQILYLIDMYKQDLALNNLQGLICH